MPKLNSKKKLDLLVVFVFIFVAAFLSVFFKIDLILSVSLYLGLPALYLWFRESKNWKKILSASLVIGVLLGMAYNLVAEFTNAYATRYGLFPFNYVAGGVTPFGDFIWGFLILFCSITFYEHFLDDERQVKFSKYSTFALGAGLVSFLLTESLLITAPESLHATYSYLLLGLLSILPLTALLFCKPTLIYKILWLTGFFFILNLVFEISALHLGQWNYPGQYIGLVEIMSVNFPIEEFIFWILLATPSLILCYEFLFDDGK